MSSENCFEEDQVSAVFTWCLDTVFCCCSLLFFKLLHNYELCFETLMAAFLRFVSPVSS